MNRVVVTGYGVVSPLGLTAQTTWEALLEGHSGVGPITLFDTGNFDVHTAAEVKGFDPAAVVGAKAARRMDRFEQLANAATQEALAHSGLAITEENNRRIGLSVGSAYGGIASIGEQVLVVHTAGPREVDPFGLLRFMTTLPSISINHTIKGPSFSAASACATGADGIGLALHLLRAGVVDAMVAGGADAAIAPLTVAALDQMRAHSHRSDHTPAPFSADRDGLIIGEGAGVMILEHLEHARKRGASILAELIGYGATNDAYHLVAPPEDGAGAADAIREAMTDARITADQIDYVNAHGTATPINDPIETTALKSALGERAYHIPINSTKSMTGHMMGAAGSVEAVLCIQAIRHGVVPPTINYHNPDPACDLDYVPNQAREAQVRIAMSNSFGFGGHNSVLIFKTFEE